MVIKELEEKLLSLTFKEKADVIQLLAKSLNQNWRGISKKPDVCGGDACIDGTRIPIWVLVESRRLGITEAELLSDYPTLTANDLTNAWLYAEANSQEIETAIQENEVA